MSRPRIAARCLTPRLPAGETKQEQLALEDTPHVASWPQEPADPDTALIRDETYRLVETIRPTIIQARILQWRRSNQFESWHKTQSSVSYK